MIAVLFPQLKEPLPGKMLYGQEEVSIRSPIMAYFKSDFPFSDLILLISKLGF